MDSKPGPSIVSVHKKPPYTYLWYSLKNSAFSLKEQSKKRDLSMNLDIINGEYDWRILTGHYSSYYNMPPVANLVTDVMRKFQERLCKVQENDHGEEIPYIRIARVSKIEIIRQDTSLWLFQYASSNNTYNIRYRRGIIEIERGDKWKICNTNRLSHLQLIVNESILKASELMIIEREILECKKKEYQFEIKFTKWEEKDEYSIIRLRAVQEYLENKSTVQNNLSSVNPE